MTREEFFGGIRHNLTRLGRSGLISLTHGDPTAPENVRVYDLQPRKGRGRNCDTFRFFVAFVPEATPEAYRAVKAAIRKWYQESGWELAGDQPCAGAMVVGAATAWPKGMMPNADDIPPSVKYQVLLAPAEDPLRGVELTMLGDRESGQLVFRALREDFDLQRERVEKYVRDSFGFTLSDMKGHTFVSEIAGAVNVDVDYVFDILNDLQGKGELRILRHAGRAEEGLPPASVYYIERGKAPLWGRLASRSRGNGWLVWCILAVSTALLALGGVFYRYFAN